MKIKIRRKRIKQLVALNLMLIVSLANAQEINVSGVVTDLQSGETLPGVYVVEKGTTRGVITNADGHYSLRVVDENVVLIFSFVGYSFKEVVVGNQTTIDVELDVDVQELKEIVVVGYGEKDKKKLTSSIATVDKNELEYIPMATFDNIIQGAASGVLVQSGTGQPGRSAALTIRGTKSLRGTDSPLYIMDGNAISPTDFKAVNPNDIAFISILKDASATQIYGSRGASGVVLITTKTGKRNQKAQVEYNTYYGVSPAPTHNSGLQPLTSSELIDLQNELRLGKAFNLPQEEQDSLKNINTDWLSATTRDARIVSHEVSVSGGGENTSFYLSGGFFSQEGTSLRSKLDRYSFRTNVTFDLINFTIGSNVYLAHTDTQDSESEGSFSNSNPFYSSIRANPYDYVYHPANWRICITSGSISQFIHS